MAERAGAHVGTPAMGYDIGHRRMIAGVPIGGAEAVADLGKRER